MTDTKDSEPKTTPKPSADEGDQLDMLADAATAAAEPPSDSAPGTTSGDTDDAKAPKPKKKRAPRKKRATAEPEGPKPPTKGEVAKLVGGVTTMATIAGATSPRLMYDAQIIQAHSDKLTDELFKLAKVNESVAKFIRSATKSTQWAGMVGIVASIGVPIAANHGLIPEGAALMVGAPPPPPRQAAPASDRFGHPGPVVGLDVDDVDDPGPDPGPPSAGARDMTGGAANTLGGQG